MNTLITLYAIKEHLMPIRIHIRNQLGLSFQRTPENVSSGQGWFLSNFPQHKTKYPPCGIATLHKKNKKVSYYPIVYRYFAAKVSIVSFQIFSILFITKMSWNFVHQPNRLVTTWHHDWTRDGASYIPHRNLVQELFRHNRYVFKLKRMKSYFYEINYCFYVILFFIPL